jgi:uncharacterized protein YjbI with pentapeptide repeats
LIFRNARWTARVVVRERKLLPAILKPSKLAASVQTDVVKDGGLTTVSAFMLFEFDDPYRLLTEQALWPMVVEQMPGGAIFDKGQLKPKGEVIIAGHALAPGDNPVEALKVTAQFAGLEKRLVVFGDRFWRLTDRGTEMVGPQPFDKMPIGPAQAFGGPDHKINPAGKGAGARAMALAGYDAPMPNVENADQLIKSIDDAPPPAHFGPLSPDNPERLQLLGTYDRHWMKRVSPLKPDDFNPLFHCDAPHDQRFDDYLTGREIFSISGMSRGGGAVGGQLPGLCVRAFVHRPQDDSLTEIKMVCETATLFPNVEKAVMTFRGVAKGEDRFGEDIGAIMLAVEKTDAQLRPTDYYHDIFKMRTDPEDAYKHAFSDFQLMPERDPAIGQTRRQERLERARAERQQFFDNQNWMTGKAMEDAGMPPELIPPVDTTPIDDMPFVAMPTSKELTSGDFDIAELIDDVEALGDYLWLKSDEEMARAELQRRAIVASTPPTLLPSVALKPIVDDAHLAKFPDIDVDPDLAAGLSEVGELLASSREKALSGLEHEVDDDKALKIQSEINKTFDQIEIPAKADDDEVEEQFRAACARALRLPEALLLHRARNALNEVPSIDDVAASLPDDMRDLVGPMADPSKNPPTGNSFDSDNPFLIPEGMTDLGMSAVKEAFGSAEEKIRKDLSHLVEEGMQDKPIAGLMAKLQKIEPPGQQYGDLPLNERFEGHRDDAVNSLDEAEPDIEETTALGRQMSPVAIFPMEPLLPAVAERLGTFVAQKLCENHDFKGTDLAGACLRNIDFSGLDLAGSFFEKADLTGASFAGCDLEGAVFTAAVLGGADFSDCNLRKVNFSAASLKGARMDRAVFEDCTLIKTDLTELNAQKMSLATANLIECILDRADLGGSRVADLQLMKGSANGLKLNDAKIERAVFMSLPMAGTVFADSALERVSFMEIEAAGADFSSAEMHSTSFMGDCDLSGANFEKIKAEETSWNTTALQESSFRRARCHGCLFNGCNMTAVDFRAASLKNSRFLKSDLTDSDFFAADLHAASMTQSVLQRASMRCANLYFADLMEAKLACCDLTGANLGKTQLEQPANA